MLPRQLFADLQFGYETPDRKRQRYEPESDPEDSDYETSNASNDASTELHRDEKYVECDSDEAPLIPPKRSCAMPAALDDGIVHRLQDFTGTLGKVIITCVLHMDPEKLASLLNIDLELAASWKNTVGRLWELQCIYPAPNLRESNFDIDIASRDLDDPRIMTDRWLDILHDRSFSIGSWDPLK